MQTAMPDCEGDDTTIGRVLAQGPMLFMGLSAGYKTAGEGNASVKWNHSQRRAMVSGERQSFWVGNDMG